MVFIGTILIGLFVGIIAKLLTPGRDPGGCLLTTLLGLAGSLVGALIGRTLGIYQPGQPAGIIASIIGAVLLLLAYRFLSKTGRR